MLQFAANPYTVALAVPGALAVVWVLQRLYIEYRLGKSPGVRAPVLANNPFSGESASARDSSGLGID